MENPYVLLETESGKWRVYAPKYTQNTFSDLIPQLDKIEDKIILKGVVAEILETEWEAYKRLFEYVRIASKRRYLHGMGAADTYQILPQPVRLHEISRISRILHMPTKWEMYVHVTLDTPQSERLEHLQHMGKLVLEEGLYKSDVERSKPLDRRRSNLTRSPYIILFSIIGFIGKDVELDVCGLVHNAILRRNEGIGITWDDLYFDDVVPLFSRSVDTISVYEIGEYLKRVM